MTQFQSFPSAHGLLQTRVGAPYLTDLGGFSKGPLTLGDHGSHYGFVQQGSLEVSCAAGRFSLQEGMYFCIPGAAELDARGGGFFVTRHGHEAFFQIGGPIEEKGRLRYIDGCTDSLLIPPILMGDPCFNLLHFPPGIFQTAHTHPSLRAGMVARGSGVCHLADRQVALEPGVIFHIPADTHHHFATTDQAMTVIAYHPDSDFGPQHDDHPMINRTMVDGVSARFLETIQTGESS